jgi:ABC-type glycerol-3-phosphate transport system substrate-binding protein
MSHRKIATAFAAIGMLVAIAGCGSDKSDSSATPTSATDDTSVASTATAASASEFCSHSTGINPAALTTADAASKQQMKDELDKALAAAPREIKGDFQTVADVERPILDGNVPASELPQKLGDQNFLTALQHIAEWSASHCTAAG